MSFKRVIRNLIIGDDKYIESYGEYKQAMLSGRFAIIGMVFCAMAAAINFDMGYHETLPILSGTFFFLILTIAFHRHGNHSLANYTLLATMNISVYILAS